jgi:hypothetical protein
VINVKILSLGAPERYGVRRIVLAAYHDLQAHFPGAMIDIQEIDDASEIGKYATVLVMPSLVFNGKIVCSGRFPTREEVAGWLHEAAKD